MAIAHQQIRQGKGCDYKELGVAMAHQQMGKGCGYMCVMQLRGGEGVWL